MRKEQFISLMEAPEKIPGESVALLDGLVGEYPYFQTAQVLLAKALSNEKSIRYESQLRIAAAYAADRKALHSLIMHAVIDTVETENIPSPLIDKQQAETLPPPVIEKEKEITPEPIAEEKEITAEPIKEDKEIVSEPAEEVTVQPKAEAIPSPETKTEEAKTEDIASPEMSEIPELPPLEQNIIVKAIDASIELEVSEEMPFKGEKEERSETSETEKAETQKAETLETDHTQKDQATEEFNPAATHSFSEWLKYAKKAKEKGPGEQPREEAEAEEKEEKKKPKSRRTIDDLIDKFISEEPKITRPQPKQEFFSPVNMARQSVQDDDEYVTETLANIYLKQGSYAKAIKAYETLSLKFPEKKLYFAARIKEIRKIIKEQK